MSGFFNDAILQAMLPNLKGRNEGLCFIKQSTLTGSAASISLTGISDEFRHLLFIASLRTDTTGIEYEDVNTNFNSDTGSNYAYIRLRVDNAAGVTHGEGILQGAIYSGQVDTADASANSFSPVGFLVYNYSDTSKLKYLVPLPNLSFGNNSAVTDLFMNISAGRWNSTAAINSITVATLSFGGGNFVAGSKAAVYGIS